MEHAELVVYLSCKEIDFLLNVLAQRLEPLLKKADSVLQGTDSVLQAGDSLLKAGNPLLQASKPLLKASNLLLQSFYPSDPRPGLAAPLSFVRSGCWTAAPLVRGPPFAPVAG